MAVNYSHGYRSPVFLSRIAVIALVAISICQMLAVFIGFAQIASPTRVIDLEGLQNTSLWLAMQGLVALVEIGLLVASAVTFLMWLHRSYANLPALRSENTEFTPGWAVGWWFIPFANLVKPFQAVRNLWTESDPDIEPERPFLSAAGSSAPGFMSLWWAFWIIGNIADNITGRVFEPDDMRTVVLSGYFFIFTGIVRTIAAALAVKVILSISDRQEQRFTKIGIAQSYSPPPPPTFEGNFGNQ